MVTRPVTTTIVDIETNGYLEHMTKIHCIVLRQRGGKARAYHDDSAIRPRHGSITDGVLALELCEEVVWHNGVGFDHPAVLKIYPYFKCPPVRRDTLVAVRYLWPDIGEGDWALVRRHKLPGSLQGSHSLEAWGYRMGALKGEYKKEDPSRWETFDRDMLTYCSRDTRVTEILLDHIERQSFPEESMAREHEFARILALQQHAGFCFDTELADEILHDLKRSWASVDEAACAVYPDKVEEVPYPAFVKSGKLYRGKSHKTVVTAFKPSSRPQIAERLQDQGWQPHLTTKGGAWKMSNDMLRDLAPAYPECALFADRFDLSKRLAQLDHGDKSWLNHVREDGRIPAGIIHNGAVTARCLHKVVTSVPKKNVPYGGRMRELFRAAPGFLLTGWDVSGIEARGLGHYLAKYDDGAYAEIVLNGDIHQVTIDALTPGNFLRHWARTHESPRDMAKTVLYAWLYGSGDWNLGCTAGFPPGKGKKDKNAPARKMGVRIRAALLSGISGLARLVRGVKRVCKKDGYLIAIDGRRVNIRHEHAALNTLLQSFGALVMKWATIRYHEMLVEQGLVAFDWWMDPADADFSQVGHWHDEMQVEHKPEWVDAVRAAGPQAIQEAGEFYNLRIALDGVSNTGERWSSTH